MVEGEENEVFVTSFAMCIAFRDRAPQAIRSSYGKIVPYQVPGTRYVLPGIPYYYCVLHRYYSRYSRTVLLVTCPGT